MRMPRRISFVRSSISPRFPVTSAAATAPAGPPTVSAMRRVMALRASSMRAATRRRRGRSADLDLADQRAHGPDTAKVGLAGEVVAARPGGLRRRQKPGGRGNELPGLERAEAPQADADPLRPALGGHPRHLADEKNEAPALAALLHALDEALEPADHDPIEHRRLDGVEPQQPGREPGERGGAADGGREGEDPSPERDRGGRREE